MPPFLVYDSKKLTNTCEPQFPLLKNEDDNSSLDQL